MWVRFKESLCKEKVWIYFTIGVAFLVTRVWQLTSLPAGLNVDEAAMAYNAYCLATYGVDRYLEPWPLVIRNFSGSQSPLYTYILVLGIKLVGYHTSLIRIPAVIFSAVTLIFGTLISRRVFRSEIGGYITALLITICPYFIQAAHVGLDCNLYLGMFTMAVYFYMIAVEKKTVCSWIMAGVFLSSVLYSYALSYVALPVFIVLCSLYLFYVKKITLRDIICLGIPVFLVAFPMMVFVLVNVGFIPPIMKEHFSIIRLVRDRVSELSFSNILENGHIFKMLLIGDGLKFVAMKSWGTLYYLSIPFVVLGVCLSGIDACRAIKKRRFSEEFFVVAMFVSIMFVTYIVKDPLIWRANAIFFPMIFFIVKSCIWLQGKNTKFIYIVLVMYIVHGICFSTYYFTQYNEDHKMMTLFNHTFTDTVAHTRATFSKETDIYVANARGIVTQPQIYLLEYYTPSPFEYQEVMVTEEYCTIYDNIYLEYPETLDKSATYLLNISYLWEMGDYVKELQAEGFTYYEYNDYRIYYVPSFH